MSSHTRAIRSISCITIVFLLIGALTLLFLLTLLLLPTVVRARAASADASEKTAPNAPQITDTNQSELARALESDPGFAEQAREFRRNGKLILPAINFRPNEASIDRPSPALRRHLELVRAIFEERGQSEDFGNRAKPGQAPGASPPTVLISGHTDRQGSREHNLALSLSRAQAIADLLQNEYELPAEALRAVGRGFSEPIADNSGAEGRQRNRRVEIQLDAQ